MKVRLGFVSNSSSSSFVISSKKEINKDILNAAFSKSFKISKTNAAYPFIEGLTDTILEHATKYTNVEDYKRESYCEDQHVPEEIRKILSEGKILYLGSVPNWGEGGNALESVVCDMKFQIKTKTFTMSKDNRY